MVAIHEMETHIRDYVRLVQEGETILLIAEDKIVTKLTSPGPVHEYPDEDIARLNADGLISRHGGENRPELFR